MSRSMHTAFSSYHMRLLPFLQKLQNARAHMQTATLSELQKQVVNATIPPALEKAVNAVQTRLWQLPKAEQTSPREQLIHALQYHTLHAQKTPLRIKAAQWLRLLIQAGLATSPQEIFVTLVTATVQSQSLNEQKAYLKEIFDCFWSFRYPYPAFSWEQFPPNSTFFPLATLLADAEYDVQELLLIIFAELPSLDEPEIITPLLPLALRWAKHSNPEYRRLIAPVLARISDTEAQAMLEELRSDIVPTVRASAHNAANYVRQ